MTKVTNLQRVQSNHLELDSAGSNSYKIDIAPQHKRGGMLPGHRTLNRTETDRSQMPLVSFLRGSAPADRELALPIERRAHCVNRSWTKRTIDVCGAFFGLLFLGPLMLVVMLAIKLDSRGPIFFRQNRYGMNKTPFQIVKFRTMSVLETSGAFVQARRDDARITRVGAFLRKTSLDELPQLWNVLRGEMSLVGPRPHAIAMDDEFARLLPGYADRHLVRPGMTGLAQIEGYRGPTETVSAIQARLSCDRIYIRTWSVGRDLRILVLTPLRLFGDTAF